MKAYVMQVGCLGNPSPWSITPSVYSMLLINVEQTVLEGALYPAKPYHEDVDFAHLCNELQLIVARCNWLYFHKVSQMYHAVLATQHNTFGRANLQESQQSPGLYCLPASAASVSAPHTQVSHRLLSALLLCLKLQHSRLERMHDCKHARV